VASLSQGRTAAAQCGLFTYKSVPVIFEPPCIFYAIGNVCNSYLMKFMNLHDAKFNSRLDAVTKDSQSI